MHTDETKRFDKRNIERNLKDGLISKKDYELYIARLPDVSNKAFWGEETDGDSTELMSGGEGGHLRRRDVGQKGKGKGR